MPMTIKRFLELKDKEMAAYLKEQPIQYQQDFIESKKDFFQITEVERHSILDNFCRKAPFWVIQERLLKLGMKEE